MLKALGRDKEFKVLGVYFTMSGAWNHQNEVLLLLLLATHMHGQVVFRIRTWFLLLTLGFFRVSMSLKQRDCVFVCVAWRCLDFFSIMTAMQWDARSCGCLELRMWERIRRLPVLNVVPPAFHLTPPACCSH